MRDFLLGIADTCCGPACLTSERLTAVINRSTTCRYFEEGIINRLRLVAMLGAMTLYYVHGARVLVNRYTFNDGPATTAAR